MPQEGVFTRPFTYWVGMETDPRATPEALAEFNRFYSTTHTAEVIAAHPGFVASSRYERVEAPLGMGPRWLAVYDVHDEASAQQYVKDNERPWLHRRKYSPWPAARKRAKIVWRLIWHQIAANGSTGELLYLVGTNAPGSAGGAVRLELYREFAHPSPGAPRLCEVYAAPAPEWAAEQEAVWRLVYRRLPPPR